MSVEAVVISWDREKATQYAADVSARFVVPAWVLSDYDHEVALLNRALVLSESKYVWLLTPDVEIPYLDTLNLMEMWMESNPEVGVLVPNREGEPRNFGGHRPYDKYLQDNTAILVRKDAGVRFDPEFIFTGWSDLDFGEEVMHQGYKVQVEPRISVVKHPTAYGGWSAFRRAYNARNRLLLEAKWYWVGRKDWRGVDAYNQDCQPGRRIPTMFELAWWGEEALNRFADGVNMEHPQILLKDDQGTGNEDWRFYL